MRKKKLMKAALVLAASVVAIVPNSGRLGMDAVVAEAEETPTEGLAGGVKWTYADGVLTFSNRDDLEGESASGIGYMAGADSSSEHVGYRAYADVVTKIVFEDGVLSVGRGDFEDFTELTTVEMADSIIRFEPDAFKNCSKLVNVTMPEHLKEICADSFYGTAIKSVEFGKELEIFGNNPFRYCKDLESITVSDENEIWTDCDSNIITTAEKVEVFAGCTNSTIPSGIKWVKDGSFQGTGITSIVFPEGFEQVYGTAFQDTPLVSVSFPSTFFAYGLHADNFKNCTQLKYINLKNMIQFNQRDMFGDCTSLKDIVLVGEYNGVSGYAFRGVDHLNLYVSKDAKSYGHPISNLETYGVKVDLYCEGSEEDFNPSSVQDENLTIHYNSYYPEAPVDASGDIVDQHYNIHWVLMGDTLVFSGTGSVDMPEEFEYKDTVKKVVFKEGITGVSGFRYWTNLEEVELPEGLRSLGNGVFGYTAIKSIHIPSTTTQIATTGTQPPFEGCMDLTEMTVAKDNPAYFSDGNAIFVNPESYNWEKSNKHLLWGCAGTVIPEDTKSIAQHAFQNSGIKEIVIPKNVESIGDLAFEGSALEKIVFEDGDKYLNLYYGQFYNCTSLKEVQLASRMKYLTGYMFYGCTSLTSVTIPSGVVNTAGADFTGSGVLELYLPKTIEGVAGGSLNPDHITHIYYEGSEEDWEHVGSSQYLTDVVVHFNCKGLYTGWTEVDGKKFYYSDTHEAMTDWQKIDGKWYYLGEDGAMATGWQKLDGKWYYLNPETGIMTNGWKQISNKWYYFNGGVMTTGWKQISGKWYYFTPSGSAEGVMVTGWKQISNKWYYFDDGAMVTGWKQISNKWYYFDDGAMVTGWKQISDKWYYFDNGAMVTGWKQVSNKWYYFETNGAMAQSKWINDTYYVKSSGVMATDEWIDGKYYVDANGKYVPGKKK